MLNKSTNEFIDALTELINKSGLPAVNIRLSLDAVRAQVFEQEKQIVQKEKLEAAKNAAEEKARKAKESAEAKGTAGDDTEGKEE